MKIPWKQLVRVARFGFAFQRPRSPQMLLFCITSKCDMACKHCSDDVWGTNGKDLSFEEIEAFCDSLGTVESVGLSGGEPFLRKDLVDICKTFAGQNGTRNLTIPSNGFETENICATVRRILEECPAVSLSIILSLDGFQATHDALRKSGSFNRAMDTARRLTALRAEFPQLTINFNATVHSANWRELPALAAFVQEEFQTHLDFTIITGKPRDAALGLPTEHELEQTVNAIYAVRKTSAIQRDFIRIYREIRLRTNVERKQIIPCRAGSLIGVVYANGDVHACPSLPLLGNLRERSFQAIWHSEEAERQWKSIIAGNCTCNDDCFIISSLNNYWKLPFLILRERMRQGR